MFCFSRNDEWILAWLRYDFITNQHFCGHNLVARRRSKCGEFCCLTTIIEDNSCRTRAWTWPSLVICDLFPVEHVQTLGGQASLDLRRVDLSFKTLIRSCLDVLSAVFKICFKILLFIWTHIPGDNFVVLRILCLLIVQFLQVLFASKSENKILQLVVAPSEKCPPLGQSLITCQLNSSQLLPDGKLRRPGTVSTSQWGDHNRLSGCKRHRKWGKWLKSTFSSLE